MSNIYFKRVTIKNFMSYEHAEIRLDTPGYILVKGENNNPADSASSNGCGKSTLFNAISWALTGQTTSGVRDVNNLYTTGETYAEVEFECNSKNYVIRRTKNPSNLKIFIDNEDMSGKGIRDSEKLLHEYLPEVTDSLINSVIILGQGLPQRFTNNTPAGRKEVLETLSKSDFMIEDIKQRLSNRKNELSNLLREVEDKLVSNDSKLDVTELNLDKLKYELSNIPSTSSLIDDINLISDKLNVELDRKEKLLDEQGKLNSERDLITDSLLNLQEDKKKELDNLELEDTIDITKLINETDIEIKTKIREIARLESVSDVCPTCGQKLPDVKKIDTTDLRNEVNNLRLDYNTLQDMFNKITNENNSIVAEVNEKFNKQYKELNDKLTDCKYKLLQLNREIIDCSNVIQTYSNDVASKNAYLQVIDNNKSELENKIFECNEIIDDIRKENIVINNKIDTYNNHLDINSKMSTIVKRDFRGFLLTNVIDFISNKCHKYSKEVFGTEDLTFKLDGNNISIAYDGKEYESLSGGEKQKVDVILQLSIRDMLCAYLNFSSNIIVLDEITDSLDALGAQKVFNLISNNLNDVETIFIISHHTDFEIPADGEINIVKGDDKISRII